MKGVILFIQKTGTTTQDDPCIRVYICSDVTAERISGNPNNPLGYCYHGDSIPCSCHMQLVASCVRASHALLEDLSILPHVFPERKAHNYGFNFSGWFRVAFQEFGGWGGVG